MTTFLSMLESDSGPTPFRSIITSVHKREIDRLLLKERRTVKDVWRWLTKEKNDKSISYVTLTRYKKARDLAELTTPSALREKQIRKHLEVLNLIIERGLETVGKGPAPRLSDVMRALDMRAAILAQFPEASDDRVEALRADIVALCELVRSVLTDEQRAALRSQLEERNWAFNWISRAWFPAV